MNLTHLIPNKLLIMPSIAALLIIASSFFLSQYAWKDPLSSLVKSTIEFATSSEPSRPSESLDDSDGSIEGRKESRNPAGQSSFQMVLLDLSHKAQNTSTEKGRTLGIYVLNKALITW